MTHALSLDARAFGVETLDDAQLLATFGGDGSIWEHVLEKLVDCLIENADQVIAGFKAGYSAQI